MDKVVYVTVRMVVDEDADVEEVIEECDYWFQFEDKIKRTVITDFNYDPEDMS